jgi:hypothetical protein
MASMLRPQSRLNSKRTQRELDIARPERDVPKKAVALFAKDK